ncbi:MAG: hypothetical protein AB7N76_07410 [Planctomycetota bacterium]
MMVTEADIQMMESSATRRAAVAAGLGSDFLLAADVLDSLRGSHPELASGLSEFLSAFRGWFDFHRRIEQAGRQGSLTPAEVGELTRLVQQKDAARARFVALVAPGPEEAPSFVQQCLEPMATRMLLEVSYLERKIWTWRFHLGECELLQPLSDTAGRVLASRSVLVANLRDAVPRHDGLLGRLVDALASAQRELESDPGLRALTVERTAAHRADRPGDAPWGAFDEDVMPRLAAQFVINNVEPGTISDSTMTRFWSSHGRDITQSAEHVMATHRPVIEAAAAALLTECRSIAEELRRVRSILETAFGV